MQKINNRIFVGSKLLEKFNSLIDITKYTKILLVVDSNVPKALVEKIKSGSHGKVSILFLKSGEEHKNLKSVVKIWEALKDFGCDRKSLVINAGGGVIGDIGGFAASTYMRGIDFLQIPTTLLAQVDASVGGKVGINFAGIKNLIGTFQQPIAVIIDVDTLSTLPEREFISGFGEIIKHGLIADKKYFQFVTSKKPLDFTQKELTEIVEKSCKIKMDLVARDEKETGPRKLLNFGHTIGHAIESLSQEMNHPSLHGEAVSIGMMIEGKISNLIGLLSDENLKILEQSIIHAGLPTKIPDIPISKILNKIKSDKKNEKGKVNWTLLRQIGKAEINQKVPDEIIRRAL